MTKHFNVLGPGSSPGMTIQRALATELARNKREQTKKTYPKNQKPRTSQRDEPGSSYISGWVPVLLTQTGISG